MVVDIMPMISTIHVSHFGVLEFAGTRIVQRRPITPQFRSRKSSMMRERVCRGDSTRTVILLFKHVLMPPGLLSTNM